MGDSLKPAGLFDAAVDLVLIQQARQRRMLLAAAGRLTRPKLACCFVEWRREWEAAEREAAQRKLVASHQQKAQSVERALSQRSIEAREPTQRAVQLGEP